ncbi:MAG: hypothetical protein OEY04_15125 [Gammaproteobacteria bacterium]|nr:hypothetical protein [Gammaproteobacteria bacterium]
MTSISAIRYAGLIAVIAAMLASCAPASLGSPPASERTERCRTGETLVCRTKDLSRINKDEEREYDFCTCESLEHGIPY